MTTPAIVRVTFTAGEWAVISRPLDNVKRFGGMQRLLAKVNQRTNKALEVDLFPQDVERVTKYAHYTSGGYEDRFLAIEAAIGRAKQ
jgi:hypothetical protein